MTTEGPEGKFVKPEKRRPSKAHQPPIAEEIITYIGKLRLSNRPATTPKSELIADCDLLQEQMPRQFQIFKAALFLERTLLIRP